MTETNTSSATVQTRPAGSVADIESGLTALWRQTVGEGVPVLRATTLNLLIVTNAPGDALDVLKVVAETHPCRAIVITTDDSAADAPIRATPSLLLHPVFGREMRSQVMCELITLEAGQDALDRLYSAVQSLTLADQPVFIWDRLPAISISDTLFHVLGEGFDTLIVDSAALTDGDSGLQILARLPSLAHFHAAVSDLNWQRLHGWREALSKQFDPPEDRDALTTTLSIEITHRDSHAGATLLLGWLVDRLTLRITASVDPNIWTARSPRGMVQLVIHTATDEVLPVGVQSLSIKTQQRLYQAVYSEAEGCIRLDSNNNQAVIATTPLSTAALLNVALDSVGNDVLYEKALSQATELSASFDQVRQRAGMVFVDDAAALSRMAAREFTLIARNAIRDEGRFTVALSGGSTPRALFELLANDPYRSDLPWAQIHVFWGDERNVPPDHAESNQRMAAETLLSKVPIPPSNIHSIAVGSMSAADAAARYAAEIRAFFQLDDFALPQFDLVLLGLGDDGHTASLFPHTAALKAEGTALFIANEVPQLNTTRLTLTAGVINNAAHVMFLVAGAGKADILYNVMRGPYLPDDHPAQRIHPAAGSLTVIADQAAAARLHPNASA